MHVDDIDNSRYDGRMPIDRKPLVPGTLPVHKTLARILDKAERAGLPAAGMDTYAAYSEKR